MEIFVKQISSKNAERLEFRLEPSESVSSLKRQVAEKLAVDETCIKLIYKGRFLKDGMDVESSGLSNGSVLHVMQSKVQASQSITGDSPARDDSQVDEVGQEVGRTIGSTANAPDMNDLLGNLGSGSNPLEGMMESNPEMRAMMEDPEQMRQMMSIASNPDLRLEYMRNMDRALSNIEAIPGGFNALASMMADVNQAPGSSETTSSRDRTDENPFLRLYKASAGLVNDNPMPNPWQSTSAPRVNMPPVMPSGDGMANLMESMFSEENMGQFLNVMQDPSIRSRILETSPQGERELWESMLTEENMRLFSRMMANPQFRSLAVRQAMGEHGSPDMSDDAVQNMLADVLASQGNSLPGLVSGINRPHPQISEEEMLAKIQALKDMGFLDEEANRRALQMSNGDINVAVERLLNM